MNENYELVVIGGGPAGLAAAVKANDEGVRRILIVERDNKLGGILNQCIHNGFGLHYFKEELTGPEYAGRFIQLLSSTNVNVLSNAMALEITPNREVHIVSPQKGYQVIEAQAVILAMGCRERTRGAISIPGDRPSGVFTAGSAQRYINIDGYMVGKKAIILGSGDIGLIMARRLTLEGAKVEAVIELMPYSNGLSRNIAQCLEDYDIPLYLSHTITQIKGDGRLRSVVVSKVDENRNIIENSSFEIPCDTLLLSVGLIPENELSRGAGIEIDPKTNGPVVFDNMQTSLDGVFGCGNVVHVHDLVDFVTLESQKAGHFAAQYIQNGPSGHTRFLPVIPGEMVNYTVPQKVRKETSEKTVELFFRVSKPVQNAKILIKNGDRVLKEYKRDYMLPAEMERVILAKSFLDDSMEEISVCVEVQ